MRNSVVQARIKNCQKSKLLELKDELHTSDESETIRACIDIAYNIILEKEEYLINFYDIKKSKLYKWLNEEKEKNNA